MSVHETLIESIDELCKSGLPLDRVFEGFCGTISHAMPVPVGILMTGTQEGLRVEHYYRLGELIEPDNVFVPSDSISADTLRLMKAQLFLDEQSWPKNKVAFNIHGEGVFTRSAIFLPLVSRGQPIGVLSVQSFVGNAYSQEDVALLERAAQPLADRVRAQFT